MAEIRHRLRWELCYDLGDTQMWEGYLGVRLEGEVIYFSKDNPIVREENPEMAGWHYTGCNGNSFVAKGFRSRAEAINAFEMKLFQGIQV